MSRATTVVKERSVLSRLQIPFEIVFVYLLVVLLILTFFDFLKVALYATLGYLALFMFLSVFVVMVSYTIYNFAKAIYVLAKH